MNQQAVTKHFAVIGHPVSHSLSPRIHAGFRPAGRDRARLCRDRQPSDFDAALQASPTAARRQRHPAVQAARAGGVQHAQHRAPARRCGQYAGARSGGWHGDNTDGAGLVRDLTGRHGLDLRKRRTLLLGAGGGARGVAPALLDAGISD